MVIVHGKGFGVTSQLCKQCAMTKQGHWQQYYISLYFCYEYSKTPIYFCSQLFSKYFY